MPQSSSSSSSSRQLAREILDQILSELQGRRQAATQSAKVTGDDQREGDASVGSCDHDDDERHSSSDPLYRLPRPLIDLLTRSLSLLAEHAKNRSAQNAEPQVEAAADGAELATARSYIKQLRKTAKDAIDGKKAAAAVTGVADTDGDAMAQFPAASSSSFASVEAGWLRLYVDSTIGIAIAHLLRQQQAQLSGSAPKESGMDDRPRSSRRDAPPAAASSSSALRVIRALDMSLIVAGGVGPRRQRMIQELIRQVQREVYSDVQRSSKGDGRGVDRRKRKRSGSPSSIECVSEGRAAASVLRFAPRPIPELAKTPSIEEYLTSSFETIPLRSTGPALRIALAAGQKLYQHPFIIRSYLSPSTCPALERWRSIDYLCSQAVSGQGRVVPVELGHSYTDRGWGQKIVSWEWFLRRVTGGKDADAGESFGDHSGSDTESEDESSFPSSERPMYLAQHSLFLQFPRLRDDLGELPEYIYASPPAAAAIDSDMSFAPPGNEEGLVLNVWIGAGGGRNGEKAVVSPAHTDPYYNCYTQIAGRKRVWLAPPQSGRHMYTFADQAQTEQEREAIVAAHRHKSQAESVTEPATGRPDEPVDDSWTTGLLSNTSRVPIFAIDRDRDAAQFPAFFTVVLPNAMEALLEPGDLLVMPPGWWHAMRAEGDEMSFSVSMWY